MGILDPVLDFADDNSAAFWTFVVMTVAFTIYAAVSGAGWASLITGPFVGVICGFMVKLALDKIKE